jgi:hypothetical protein
MFELIRARCSRLQALPGEVTLMSSGFLRGITAISRS